MDTRHERTEDLGREILNAFEDLSRLAYHGAGDGMRETPQVASALLQRVVLLCQASRAALVLAVLPTGMYREGIPFSSDDTIYRSLALSNIQEKEMDVLLSSAPAATQWTNIPAADAAWLIWRLPLVLSFSPLFSANVKRLERTGIDDLPSTLQACFLFGWGLQHADQQALLLEQVCRLLSPLADAVGTVLIQMLTSEYVRELEIHTEHRSLREMELLKAELLASVSHELRSPLTSIKGYASTLLRHERRIGREERHEFLLAINEASDQLAGVIDTLLEMSELETGRIDIERVPVDLTYLMREALTFVRRRVETTEDDGSPSPLVASSAPKRLAFQLLFGMAPEDAGEQQLLIEADRNRLREVLDHLLDNAINHTPTGGIIRLFAYLVGSAHDLKELVPFSQDGGGRLARALQRHHRMVVIGIQDSGKGIPPNALERIFDPFYRVDIRLTRDMNGLGLGLAICRRIIELHHGSIWAESQEGGGSTFFVCLPLNEKNEAWSLDN